MICNLLMLVSNFFILNLDFSPRNDKVRILIMVTLAILVHFYQQTFTQDLFFLHFWKGVLVMDSACINSISCFELLSSFIYCSLLSHLGLRYIWNLSYCRQLSCLMISFVKLNFEVLLQTPSFFICTSKEPTFTLISSLCMLSL